MKKKVTKAKAKAKAKVKTSASIGSGWLTTDEEEIERRRLRAIEENLKVKRVQAGKQDRGGIYADYLVSSPSGSQYLVEFRDKQDRINSCGCPDHQINRLGTCKHIERVTRFLLRKKTPDKRSCTEIFINRQGNPVIEILWADKLRANSKVRKLCQPYFASDNTMLAETLDAFKTLEREIYQAGLSARQIKLSAQIIPWLENKETQHQAAVKRQNYVMDVESGKRNGQVVRYPLYDYQSEGMLHLAFKRRAILADEMGLGKTVQALAACELLHQLHQVERVLVISPVSLKTEWEEQINKFTRLPSRIIQGNRAERLKGYQQESFYYLCNYEQLFYDVDDIQTMLMPDVIILDEAQRIKNWQTKTAQTVKRLQSPYFFVLTGTPLENRIDEIYSIAQVVDPHLLGSLFHFNREFYQLDEKGKPTGYKNLDQLHRRLRPILLRRRKHDVEDELPERINNTYFVAMHHEQEVRYDEYKSSLAQILHKAKRMPLKPEDYKNIQINLACMRMLCDTPYILDPECRVSPKLQELKKILSEQLENPENKIIIFSEWTKMLDLIRDYLGEQGLDYALHTGQVPQKKRRAEISRFKNDPQCRLFLSSDAGATGLNLQIANIVINMDLPWNPARLEQRIARAWRKHQQRQVNVINLVCESSIEHRIMSILAHKSALAEGVIDGSGETDMDLPSGRKFLIERIEQIMGAKSPASQVQLPAQTDPVHNLYDQVMARHPDTLEHFSVFENQEGNNTVFSVISETDKQTDQVIRELAGEQVEGIDALEVIDSNTMATIQRLVDAGILSFNTAKESMLTSEASRVQQNKQQQTWINQALKRFAEVERKLSMSELLYNGDFKQEALAPLSQALELAISCLYQALTGKLEAQLETAIINDRLQPEFDFLQDTETILNSLRANSDSHQLEAMQLVKELTEKVDESLLGRLLS